MKHAKGFTLLELLIVVAIIGIIASIGLPAYSAYVIRGKLADAPTQLADARVKLEQYFQDARSYVGWTCPANTKYFTLGCVQGSTTYTLTATSTSSLDKNNTYTYTINQDNTKTSTTPFSNNAVVQCWYMKKGDSC